MTHGALPMDDRQRSTVIRLIECVDVVAANVRDVATCRRGREYHGALMNEHEICVTIFRHSPAPTITVVGSWPHDAASHASRRGIFVASARARPSGGRGARGPSTARVRRVDERRRPVPSGGTTP